MKITFVKELNSSIKHIVDDVHNELRNISGYNLLYKALSSKFESLKVVVEEKPKEKSVVDLKVDDCEEAGNHILESHDHGSLIISKSDIYDNLKIVNEKVRDVIYSFINSNKITCLLKLGTIRENKLTISCYGVCKYKTEHVKKFHFKFNKQGETDQYKMVVTSIGSQISEHVSSPQFLQIRGNKRLIMQKELANKSVKMFLLEKKINVDCDLALSGNTQNLMKKNTAYKMKSEFKSAGDLIKTCDVFDLLAEADKNTDNYIQKVYKFYFICFFFFLIFGIKGIHSDGGGFIYREAVAATFWMLTGFIF